MAGMNAQQLHTFAQRASKSPTVPMSPDDFAAATHAGLVEGGFNSTTGHYDAKLTEKGQAQASKVSRDPRTNLVVDNR